MGASDEESKKLIGCKTIHPSGKAGNTEMQHKSKGTDDLDLIQSQTSGKGIKRCKMSHDRIQVKKPKLIHCGSKLGRKPFTLEESK